MFFPNRYVPLKRSRVNGYPAFFDSNTEISKIVLVKGGHGLEDVRLNLFSVTISSVRTIGLPAPFL
jgi:hypothetical protein